MPSKLISCVLPPLPLGEGWGEGLISKRSAIAIQSLTLALSQRERGQDDSRRRRLRHFQRRRFHRRDGVRAIVDREVSARAMIAAVLDSAEGQLTGRAGGGAIPVHHAGADVAIECIEQRPVIAE